MMLIKQWFVLVCIFLGYVLFGATVLYLIESKEEARRLEEETRAMREIEVLIKQHYVPEEEHTQNDIFYKISNYCEKPLGGNVPATASTLSWTFYHAVFFVLTVISTIGYGNLSPTTPFTRAFIIIYGIIGIPINGIVVITLGNYFGKTFLKLYKRWKNIRVHRSLATLGLIGQIILYSIPGFTFLILIPSLIIVLYEDWTYDKAIEFAFATLTTIGVGNVIPGTNEHDRGFFIFIMYKIFLLLWIIIGLGYLAMVFGFISRGLTSKRMHTLEHKIARNIKKTNRKIRKELRSLLNEYLMMRVKPVYRERRINSPMKCQRTQSCPDLRLGKYLECCKVRKRAFSEMPPTLPDMLCRRQSDTDLQNIDKEQTFRIENNDHQHNQLLLRVVNALSNYNTMACSTVTGSEETDTYFDFESDRYVPQSPREDRKSSVIPSESMRPRAASESIKEKTTVNFSMPWVHRSTARCMQEMREREKYGKARSRTLPPIEKSQGIFTKLRNTFKNQKEENKAKVKDIEIQICDSDSNSEQQKEPPPPPKFSTVDKDHLLEETSLADFLRALTIINFREVAKPRRKFGTADPCSIPRKRRLPITPLPKIRKTSLMPVSPSQATKQRKFSLNAMPLPSLHESDLTPPLSPLMSELVAPSSSRVTIQNERITQTSNTTQSAHRQTLKSVSKIVDNKNKND